MIEDEVKNEVLDYFSDSAVFEAGLACGSLAGMGHELPELQSTLIRRMKGLVNRQMHGFPNGDTNPGKKLEIEWVHLPTVRCLTTRIRLRNFVDEVLVFG